MKNTLIIGIYVLWIIASYIISFTSQGMNSDNFTHLLIAGFLILQLISYPILKKISKQLSSKYFFILAGTIFAAIVEGFYMISNPVNKALIITTETSFVGIIGNYVIDLIFTIPVYIVVFFVIWHFINKYDYEIWQYLLLFGLAQALGDGLFFFISAPLALILIPYVMMNYHSMNLIPFLSVKDNISPNKSGIMKYLLPFISIIIIYFIAGFLINFIGSSIGLFI